LPVNSPHVGVMAELFDSALNLEQQFIQEGYQEGLQ
jgi:hypothetical protein